MIDLLNLRMRAEAAICDNKYPHDPVTMSIYADTVLKLLEVIEVQTVAIESLRAGVMMILDDEEAGMAPGTINCLQALKQAERILGGE